MLPIIVAPLNTFIKAALFNEKIIIFKLFKATVISWKIQKAGFVSCQTLHKCWYPIQKRMIFFVYFFVNISKVFFAWEQSWENDVKLKIVFSGLFQGKSIDIINLDQSQQCCKLRQLTFTRNQWPFNNFPKICAHLSVTRIHMTQYFRLRLIIIIKKKFPMRYTSDIKQNSAETSQSVNLSWSPNNL